MASRNASASLSRLAIAPGGGRMQSENDSLPGSGLIRRRSPDPRVFRARPFRIL